jgi:hypothetical protein
VTLRAVRISKETLLNFESSGKRNVCNNSWGKEVLAHKTFKSYLN